jgi:hypothetical protein
MPNDTLETTWTGQSDCGELAHALADAALGAPGGEAVILGIHAACAVINVLTPFKFNFDYTVPLNGGGDPIAPGTLTFEQCGGPPIFFAPWKTVADCLQ